MNSRLREKYVEIWNNTPGTFPMFREHYNVGRQKENEAGMNRFADETVMLIKGYPDNSRDDADWGSDLKKLIFGCGVEILGLEERKMRILLEDGFCNVTYEFVAKARDFDPGFKTDDIFQSLRNVWIMNCIQRLFGQNVEMTPAVFAYSMLYPYTDNYLDAGNITERDKKLVNGNFRKRLAGESAEAGSALENKLFRLVEMIEGQFERNKYPCVYGSLLGIQTAQERSMEQSAGKREAKPDILDISIEKGGSSVLADGCLVNGSLNEEEASFIFGFGVLLQLLDDLQDAAQDSRNRYLTLFSGRDGSGLMEERTNRLINFTAEMLDNDKCFNTPEATEMKSLIRKSVLFLLFAGVACNSGLYGRDYLRRLETHSPLSFKYLNNFFKRFGREIGKLKLKFAVMPLEIPMAKAFASGSIS